MNGIIKLDTATADVLELIELPANNTLFLNGDGEFTAPIDEDEKVKATFDDLVADYLIDKIRAGANLAKGDYEESGYHQVLLEASDEKVKADSLDSTASYLNEKITIAISDYLELTTIGNIGSFRNLELATTAALKDHIADANSGYVHHHQDPTGFPTGWVYTTDSVTATFRPIPFQKTFLHVVADVSPSRADVDLIDLTIGNLTDCDNNYIYCEKDLSTDYYTLGTLNSIGSTVVMSSDQWAELNGMIVNYTAEEGCYFNIKNDGIAGANCKGIQTTFKNANGNTDVNLYRLKKATFVFRWYAIGGTGEWFVISYEKWQWHKRCTIGLGVSAGPNTFTINTSVPGQTTPTFELPVKGHYDIEVFVKTAEYDAPGIGANVAIPRELYIYDDAGGGYLPVLADISDSHNPAIGSPGHKLIGNSVQGSKKINIQNAAGARGCKIDVVLPNGAVPFGTTILGGYIDIEYIEYAESAATTVFME